MEGRGGVWGYRFVVCLFFWLDLGVGFCFWVGDGGGDYGYEFEVGEV